MLEQNFSAIFDESLIEQNVWRHILGITLSLICGAILGFEGFKKSKKVIFFASTKEYLNNNTKPLLRRKESTIINIEC